MTPDEAVTEHLQERAVLVGRGVAQPFGEERPGLLAVQRGRDAQLEFARRQHPIGIVGGVAAGRTMSATSDS